MEKLLNEIRPIADENGMEAFIVGSKAHYEGDEYWPDGRLLKICPKGVRTRVLLEIEAGWGGYKLYRHRSSELTERYKGRQITPDWIIGFLRNNASLAAEIAADNPSPELSPPRTPAPKPLPLSDDEIEEKRKERRTVSCLCRGEVEDCMYCFGKGFYEIDGFGNRI